MMRYQIFSTTTHCLKYFEEYGFKALMSEKDYENIWKFMNVGKALRASIFESKRLGNASNGISSYYDDILLLCEDGCEEVDLNFPPENLCKVVKRRFFGDEEYVHIEPVAPPTGVGYMSGGSLVYSSDSRFERVTGVSYPVQLHDRCESQRIYDMMSH